MLVRDELSAQHSIFYLLRHSNAYQNTLMGAVMPHEAFFTCSYSESTDLMQTMLVSFMSHKKSYMVRGYNGAEF